jgi:hypothetical protein
VDHEDSDFTNGLIKRQIHDVMALLGGAGRWDLVGGIGYWGHAFEGYLVPGSFLHPLSASVHCEVSCFAPPVTPPHTMMFILAIGLETTESNDF